VTFQDERDAARARTVAVLTAFGPDERLRVVVDEAARQCAQVIVVDNTPLSRPGAETLLEPRSGLIMVRNSDNVGLAAALNRGIGLADPAADRVLLLDQDSAIPDGLVASLSAHLDADPRIGIASPAPWDETAGRYLDPRASSRALVSDLPVVITSGMVIRRRALDEVGLLRTDFFVDSIDQDLCLRMRGRGWRVVQDRRVHLPHSLGETQWHGWGPLRLRATHHPTWRLYWVARNSVVLVRESWRREPAWCAVSLALLGYWALTIVLFEPPRWSRLATLLRGCRDGWTGRTDRDQMPDGTARTET
jgi:rhamnosyltransferase